MSRPVTESAAPAPALAPAHAPAHAKAQVVQGRVAFQLRSQGEVRQTQAEEATGHHKYQEMRLAARSLTQTGVSACASIRVKDFGDGRTLNAIDAAGAGRSADWLNGSEVTQRLVTMDGVTAPLRSRRVTEFLNLERFKEAGEADRARWIHHGMYAKFPVDFLPKQQSSDADFEQFFGNAFLQDNEFKQYLVVDCLQDSAAAIVDAYEGRLQLAHRMGDAGKAAALEAEREACLADESTGQPRRMVTNHVFNTANQPGLSMLGLDMRVSDNSEGAHSIALFPRG